MLSNGNISTQTNMNLSLNKGRDQTYVQVYCCSCIGPVGAVCISENKQAEPL